MANPLMSILGGFGGKSGSIMLKAVGAMMRGDSPQDFLRDLARTTPELQGMDLSDINATASRLCRERGIDEAKITAEIKQSIAGMTK